MLYIIVNKYGNPLNAFHPNGIPDVFSFSKKSYSTFQTKADAKEHIDFIHSELMDNDNRERWGADWTDKHTKTFNTLKIRKEM